uniref:G_PROTEIN_RECEP_F1_2 domain-containing protein n=1 Tax=Steinernema glaseri TaxID=37863 RepID=A0A1I8A5I9_9BILA
MMIALTMVVVVNNSKSEDGTIMQILAFDTLILTHVNNALALIVFNPEVRALLKRATVVPTSFSQGRPSIGRPAGTAPF